MRVSYLGVDDMAQALYDVAEFLPKAIEAMAIARELVREELAAIYPRLLGHEERPARASAPHFMWAGRSRPSALSKAFRLLGMRVVLAGSQTGTEARL